MEKKIVINEKEIDVKDLGFKISNESILEISEYIDNKPISFTPVEIIEIIESDQIDQNYFSYYSINTLMTFLKEKCPRKEVKGIVDRLYEKGIQTYIIN